MAKACECGFLLEALERDPRLVALPLAVRMLWLLLVRRMQAMGQSALVLGSEIPNPREIAMMVAVSETELETQLVPLLARGLLMRREDGALECPLLAARVKRAETARINGLKGGRPRRDGQPVAQRTLLMGVPGGASVADAKTHAEPVAAPVGSVAKLAKPSSEKQEAKLAAVPDDFARIGAAAMEAAGFDPVRWTGHCGMVRTWLQAGASEALILDVIRRVRARGGKVPGHFGYFDGAVRDALAADRAFAPAPGVVFAEGAEAYSARYEAWQRQGGFGAPPVRQVAA